MILAQITITPALIIILCVSAVVAAIAILYLVASIEVHNEMRQAKKEKENELSFKNHDWKKFKNKPWEEDIRHFS